MNCATTNRIQIQIRWIFYEIASLDSIITYYLNKFEVELRGTVDIANETRNAELKKNTRFAFYNRYL